MNILFIYDIGWELPLDFNLKTKGLGGSETWLIETTSYLQSTNNQCIIVYPKYYKHKIYVDDNNVIYINKQYLDSFLTYTHIDKVCFVRWINSDIINIINNHYNKLDLYVVVHDIYFWYNNEMCTKENVEKNNFFMNNCKKIICMSQYGINICQYYTQLPLSLFDYTGNGINFSYFNEQSNINKDNSILWSSCPERGLEQFANNIFPIYKQEFPDAKLYVATYTNNFPESLQNNKDIIYLGGLGKEDLYNEMQKHKVYFYPNFFPETFCITILEAILCGCDLVMPFKHGPQTTLSIFKDLFLDESIDFLNCNEKIYEESAKLLIDYNKTYYNSDRIQIRTIMKNYILKEYSWENICKKFINILK